jgi:hypothetical protein
MSGQPGFFDRDRRYAALSAAGDPLERLARVIDFEVFRPELETALARSERAKGGRPYDAVLMFKILVLQTLYTLSARNSAEIRGHHPAGTSTFALAADINRRYILLDEGQP